MSDAALDVYLELLGRYHRTLDLVSPRAFAEIDRWMAEAERYAAAVSELAPVNGPVLDLGSGAGLPGVVVAARLAPRPVWWVERRRRRAAFLAQVAARAGLTAVRIVNDDVRSLERPAEGVAAVTAQGVGSLGEVAELTHRLWGPRVLLVSRRGPGWRGEVEALAAWWRRTRAEDPSATHRVLRAEPLGTRGTLIAVEALGG